MAFVHNEIGHIIEVDAIVVDHIDGRIFKSFVHPKANVRTLKDCYLHFYYDLNT